MLHYTKRNISVCILENFSKNVIDTENPNVPFFNNRYSAFATKMGHSVHSEKYIFSKSIISKEQHPDANRQHSLTIVITYVLPYEMLQTAKLILYE